jgi:hypothetical protein
MLDTRALARTEPGLCPAMQPVTDWPTDDSDPLTRFNGPHLARCPLPSTPTDQLTDQTCDCRGDRP